MDRLDMAEVKCSRDSDGISASAAARCSSTDSIMVGVSTLILLFRMEVGGRDGGG